jgi:hypothetical protein
MKRGSEVVRRGQGTVRLARLAERLYDAGRHTKEAP